MDIITDEEKKIVDELRKRTLADATPKMLEDDSLFYRFAKGRDFNLLEAELMLRKHIAWIKEFGVDTILTDYKPPEVFAQYGASSFIGFDKEGGVVRIQDWGRVDVKNLFNIFTKEDLGRYCAYISESDTSLIIKRGGNFWKPVFYLMYDLEELTYGNAFYLKGYSSYTSRLIKKSYITWYIEAVDLFIFITYECIQYLLYAIKMLLDNFPEMVKTITIINAPAYFPWIYATLKTILPTSITHKFRIYSTDGFKETLLEEIDADVLPVYLGGNKTDPDGNPLCETLILRGKPIPEKYHRQNEDKGLILAPDTQKLTVKPRSKEEISFEVKEANLYLEWEFKVQKRDIEFSLMFREETCKNFESMVLIPKQRTDTSSNSEKGFFKCDKLGSYVIVFDNSSSWIHSKQVYYRAGVKSLLNNALCTST